jgi:nitrate reductase NapAB chaperone NapD
MALTPPPDELSYNLGGTNHTFEASVEICSNCHGAFDGDGLQNVIEGMVEDLKAYIEFSIEEEIQNLLTAGYTVEVTGEDAEEGGAELIVVIVDGDMFDVELTESHGRNAMDITVNATTVYHVQLQGSTVVDNSVDPVTSLLDTSDEARTIAKAGWNFSLIEADGSHGVHNPSFTQEVLVSALWQLSVDYPGGP